jgi:predicted transcriptional regulator
MIKSERPILRVLFPEVRAKLLQLLFSIPAEQYYVRELTNKTGLALHTVQDELRKLTAIGLLSSSSNGYDRFYRANRDHTLFKALSDIVQANAKLPKAKRDALERRRTAGSGPKRTQGIVRKRLPRDLPMRWGLFSKRRET